MSIEFYIPSNSNYESDGNVSLKPKKAIFKLSLNGVSEIEIDHPYDKEGRWKLLLNEGVIKAPTPYSEGQLFSIYSIKKNMFKTGLIIKARHIFFDLYHSTTEDIRAVNCTCKKALDILLEGTKYTGYSNIDNLNTCYFVKQNRIAAINGDKDNTILKRWGGEIFLDNYKVYINNKIGDDYGVSISYGINMLDLGITEDMQNVVTRIKPVAFNGRRLPELYIDSPLINKYRITYEKYVEFGNLKLKDDLQNEADTEDGSIIFKTEEELYNAMREECKKLFEGGIDKPNLKGSVKMAALENTESYKDVKGLVNVSLGDTITVYNKMLNIDFKTRCIGYEWDILSKKYLTIQVGDYVKNYFENQTDIKNKIDSILNSNGNVKSESLIGVIDAVKTQFRAMRDIAQPQEVRAMIFEDKIKGSSSYGAMCLGSMGFMIASERTPDNKDWNWTTFGTGQGFFADWLVGKLKTVLIESIDGNSYWNLETGDMQLASGRILGKNSSWDLETGIISFTKGLISGSNSNWNLDTGEISFTKGMIRGSNSYWNLDTGYFYLDKGKIVGTNSSWDLDTGEINFTKGLIKGGNSYWNLATGEFYLADGQIVGNGSSWDLKTGIINLNKGMIKGKNSSWDLERGIFKSKETYGDRVYEVEVNSGEIISNNYLNIYTDGLGVNMAKRMKIGNGYMECYVGCSKYGVGIGTPDGYKVQIVTPLVDQAGSMHISEDLTVAGKKNRVVDTEHYGKIAQNAYETCECYFGDIGRGKLKNGKYIIRLDPKFLETVNTDIKYEVRTWPYGNGTVWVDTSKMYKQYVVVEGTADIEFGYEVMVKQKGYEKDRLEEVTKNK